MGFERIASIQNRVARFGVAQKVDERDGVVRRAGERANDEIEIRRGESLPAIRPNHSEFSL